MTQPADIPAWVPCASADSAGSHYDGAGNPPQHSRRILLAAATVVLSCAVGSCQIIGPTALSHGRPNYNEVIQRSSAEQILQNIVRVWFQESTFFMEVSEVDAQLTFSGQLTGGEIGIGGRSGGGASGAVSGVSATGSASASLLYAEQPTIRYVPLQGQALIQQIATPIDVDSIANLFDSDWPLIAVLDLATDRLTPRYADSYSALNAIVDLDQYGALVLAAGKSQLSAKKEEAQAASLPKGTTAPPIVIQTGAGAGASSNDSLVLFFEPDRVGLVPIIGAELHYRSDEILPEPHPSRVDSEPGGNRSIRFNDYRGNGGDTCLSPPTDVGAQRLAAKKNVLHLWIRLLDIYDGTQPLSDEITAAAAPLRRKGVTDRRPTASTENREPHAPLPKYPSDTDRKQFEQRVDAAVTDRELDSIIKSLPRSIELRTSPIAVSGYRNRAPVLRTRSALGLMKTATSPGGPIVFLPTPEAEDLRAESRNNPDLNNGFLALDGDRDYPSDTALWARKTNCILYTRWLGSEDYSQAHDERELGDLRAYLVIETSKEPPSNAYVAVQARDGSWFSINKADKISQSNFALITQIMTMRAVPAQTPPLTPTIPVGGRSP